MRAYSIANYNVTAIGCKEDVGIYSKYGDIYVIDSLDSIINIILNKLYGNELIHITSDVILNYLIDHYPELFEKYNFFPKLKDAIVFRDKLNTAKFAQILNVPCPETFRFDDLAYCSKFKFPLIGKWNKTVGKTIFKTVIIDSYEVLEKTKDLPGFSNLIFQQYIFGECESDISYGGYWINGVEQVGIVVQQSRQYAGLASKVEEISNEPANVVRRYANKLLKAMDYSGFVEVECRVDDKTGVVYLIEVNPRACGWIKVLMKNFSHKVLCTNTDSIKVNERRKWINIVRDVRALLYGLKRSPHQFNVSDIFIDYTGHGVKDIFEITDIKPFFMQLKKIMNR
ncbi:hypothetical protein SAMN05216233_1198 [Desulfoluna spongiiphila]|uniref:ATP-grasp domain-containing protein n=1 Tax=Desulfoluna spongiiphila TaxID=419481 RepID=A0A1G5IC27_9BACT|nr:hypothetical protein SAMN05216233_1198 [Desulfoluna spongiiphila]